MACTLQTDICKTLIDLYPKLLELPLIFHGFLIWGVGFGPLGSSLGSFLALCLGITRGGGWGP